MQRTATLRNALQRNSAFLLGVIMQFSVATAALKSMSPYSQSRLHDEPAFEKESKDAYEKRTWLSKAHIGDKGTLVIPAVSMHQAIMEGAKYSKRQIPGQGKATWTAKFKSGIAIMQNIDTGIRKDDVPFIDVWCDAQGKTGAMASTRVQRRFPQVPEWEASFDIWILDPIITADILREMLDVAGLFIGIGRWRPSMSAGMNGRFSVTDLKWQDNRKLQAA